MALINRPECKSGISSHAMRLHAAEKFRTVIIGLSCILLLLLPSCAQPSQQLPLPTETPIPPAATENPDKVAPVLTLQIDPITVFVGEGDSSDLPSFVTAIDDVDGDISGEVLAFLAQTEDFDNQITDKYVVVFTATDSAGNKGSLDARAIMAPAEHKPFVGFWYHAESDTGFYFNGSGLFRNSDSSSLGADGILTISSGQTLVLVSEDVLRVEHTSGSSDTYRRGTLDEYNSYMQKIDERAAAKKPAPTKKPSTTTITDGMYLVGSDIAAGTYKLACTGSSAYWERAKDATGELDSIIANDNFTTTAYVTVHDGNYLTITRCVGVLQ